MKKTLYQIIGVEPDASAQDIALAYNERLAQINAAPSVDSHARGLLRQANQILSDSNQRAAYDASLSIREARPVVAADWVHEPTLFQAWGKWIAIAIAVIGLVMWWATRSKSLPKQNAGPPQGISRTIEGKLESAPPAGRTANSANATASASAIDGGAAPAAAARSAENVFAEISPSIARVNVSDGSGRTILTGSGVVIDNGVVLTNCHVAKGGTTLAVKFGEKVMPATIQLADEALDLCRLNVPGLGAPVVGVGSVASLRTGQRVYAIGAPAGLDLTISEGIVSALRDVDDGTVIQTTAPISPGSSGGGLFDISGKLVGIMTFQHRYGQNLNFAVPADWIRQMRQRSTSELTRRSVNAVERTQDQSPATLIVGQWVCRGSITGRAGHYTFDPDGSVNIAMTDGKVAAGKYRIAGKVLQIALQVADTNEGAMLMVEELSAPRMVLFTGVEGHRLACERQ